MKLIDLLNKIANGEVAPKKFKYDNEIFIFDDETNDYIYAGGNVSFFTDYFSYIYHLEDILMLLNAEVEIIEEKKDIEQINVWYEFDGKNNDKIIYFMCTELKDKINELVKTVNELKNKED